jgi:hypothetical protein
MSRSPRPKMVCVRTNHTRVDILVSITMDPEAAGLAALAAGGMDLRAQTRMQGLGALDALPDHLLVHILSFLPAKQLCVVSCVSAAMHVFAAVFSRPATQEEAP